MPDITSFEKITCPYCYSSFDTEVDLSAGQLQDYYEDCQVCCAPVELIIHMDDAGALTQIETRRGNG